MIQKLGVLSIATVLGLLSHSMAPAQSEVLLPIVSSSKLSQDAGSGAAIAASVSSAGNTYTGCLKANGKIEHVAIGQIPQDAPKNCKDNETQISWNEVGPAGPAGPPGPAGKDGASAFYFNLPNTNGAVETIIKTSGPLQYYATCDNGTVRLFFRNTSGSAVIKNGTAVGVSSINFVTLEAGPDTTARGGNNLADESNPYFGALSQLGHYIALEHNSLFLGAGFPTAGRCIVAGVAHSAGP